jgi:hypothetical protein
MAWWRKLKKNNAVAVTLAPEGRFGHFLGSFLGTAQDSLPAAKTYCQSTGQILLVYRHFGVLPIGLK